MQNHCTIARQKKFWGGAFPLYKKERERRSRAFPSDSNPGHDYSTSNNLKMVGLQPYNGRPIESRI